MSGININNLPQNLQQKLSPYVCIAKDIESAIEMAKQAGKWSDADDKAYNALNGGANWGKVMDEYSFDSSKAAEYKKEAQAAKSDAKVYHADNYKSNTQRRAELQKSIAANKAQGGIAGYAKAVGDAIQYHMTPEKDGVAHAASPYAWVGALALAVGTVALTSCNNHDEIIENNFVNNNTNVITLTFDTSSLINAMTQSQELQQKIATLLEKIANNTSATNEEISALREELKQLKLELEKINNNVVTLLNNQKYYADSADGYYNQILNVIKGNQSLLNYIVDRLTEGNDILKQIKELMEKNNATQEEILEAVTKCKYGVEVLHEDNEDIKNLLVQINAAIAKLPDALKDKFSAYFTSIISGIADNGDKLDELAKMQETLNAILAKLGSNQAKLEELANLLTAINNNTVMNGETQKAILDAINNNHTDMIAQFTQLIQIGNDNKALQEETNNLIKQLAEAVKNLNVQPVSLDAIIRAINANGANLYDKLSDITLMLGTINANIVEGNDNNKLMFSKILEALCKKPEPDFSKILAKLDEILKAIKDHKVTVDVTGKITVECNCGNGTTHEGVIEDLDWILG